MKFKIQHKQPFISPTTEEEKLKAEILKMAQSDSFKNTTALLKEIEELLKFKRMNHSHIAYITGANLTISMKRIFKQVTIFEVIKDE